MYQPESWNPCEIQTIEEKFKNMKRVLMVATVASMIGQFNMSNIEILQSLGYEVGVACDFADRSVWTEERIGEFVKQLKQKEIVHYQIDFSRSPLNIQNIKAYKQLKKIVKEKNIDLIHCHTPVAGVISRMVAHKTKTKVIYTAHGFHFYDGAPKKNWMIFYPVEKFFSRWTDVLITINTEDYNRAMKKFHAKKIVYVPGVGVDVDKYSSMDVDVTEKRKELNIDKDDILLISVGELSKRKNHEMVIRSLANIQSNKVKYMICGRGGLYHYLQSLIEELHLNNKVQLLGFRGDIGEICKSADIFVFPSFQEGLPVSLMEAMSNRMPVVASDIRGNRDLIEHEKCGYLFDVISDHAELELGKYIKKLVDSKTLRENMGYQAYEKVKEFEVNIVDEKMREIYICL